MSQIIKLTENTIKKLITEVVKDALDNYVSMDMDSLEYPVEDDTFTGSIIYYTNNGPVTNNGVTFVKVIRPNSIYPPYCKHKCGLLWQT